MRLAANTRAFFFLGWLAWWAACWMLIYAEYSLRAKEWLTPYGVEAWLAMVTPLVVFAVADQLVMFHYERIWEQFTNNALGPLVLEAEALDRLRDELRRNLLLRWLAPRKARSLRAQLTSAADWLPGLLTAQENAARFAEASLKTLFALLCLAGLTVLYVGSTRQSSAIAVGILALSLVGLGFHAVKIAARRQAVFDYFAAWRASADEAA